MAVARAPFRLKNIVPPVLFQQMGPFAFAAVETLINQTGLLHQLARIADAGETHPRVHHQITLAVLIGKQGRIDAIHGQETGGFPGALGGWRGSDHLHPVGRRIPPQGSHHPKTFLIKGNIRRPIAKASRQAGKSGGIRIGKHMAHRFPMHQITAVADRQSGRHHKRGIDQPVIFASAQDGRIGTKTADHRVSITVLQADP